MICLVFDICIVLIKIHTSYVKHILLKNESRINFSNKLQGIVALHDSLEIRDSNIHVFTC